MRTSSTPETVEQSVLICFLRGPRNVNHRSSPPTPEAPPTQATVPEVESLSPGEPNLRAREVNQICPEKFVCGTEELEALPSQGQC